MNIFDRIFSNPGNKKEIEPSPIRNLKERERELNDKLITLEVWREHNKPDAENRIIEAKKELEEVRVQIKRIEEAER